MPTIKELDGLPKGEIELLVATSERSMVELMEQKFDALKTGIDTRLDQHDANVDTRLTAQDVKLEEVYVLVQRIDSKGDAWHEEDTVYRKTTDDRITKIESLMRTIKVWIMTFRAFGYMRRAVIYSAKEGRPLLIGIAAITGAFSAVIQLIHVVYPLYLKPWWIHHILH